MDTSLPRSRTTGVVIPAYNEADNLHQVLTAVCAATWLKEIIVVDDGSTDATFEAANRFMEFDPRLVVMRLPENQGKAAALLTGVRALHTDLVFFSGCRPDRFEIPAFGATPGFTDIRLS